MREAFGMTLDQLHLLWWLSWCCPLGRGREAMEEVHQGLISSTFHREGRADDLHDLQAGTHEATV